MKSDLFLFAPIGRVFITLVIAILQMLSAASCLAKSTTSADQVFSVLQDRTFQIRIIENKSGSQAALGTGFLVSPDRIATNYHVVSNEILEPKKYRVEVELSGKVHNLNVLTVDVVHDLAILQLMDVRLDHAFSLSSIAPKNGEVTYSLGNPHNLGLTIVEGNYNGLVENKFIDRIHFSGAINSGMSGGPAVNADFEVIGVNVATGGNQVGFLVPVKFLSALLQKSQDLPNNYSMLDDMTQQISDSTSGMIQVLVDSDWPQETMGTARVPGNTLSWLTCWGNSKDDDEKGLLNISRGCNNGDNIFLNHHFTTGYFEYEYAFFEAPDWPTAAFYRFLKSSTSDARAGNIAGKEDVHNYQCVDKIVKPVLTPVPLTPHSYQSIRRRVSYCIRPYKRFKGLYDAFYIGVSQDRDNKSVLEHYTISGVNKASSLLFLKKFMAVLAWES